MKNEKYRQAKNPFIVKKDLKKEGLFDEDIFTKKELETEYNFFDKSLDEINEDYIEKLDRLKSGKLDN